MQTYWDTQSRQTPLLMKPKSTEPYYTRTVLPIEECRCTKIPRAQTHPPANQAKVFRALLHQDSITYRSMQTYWDTQSRQTPLLMKPKSTEPYYTRTVLPIEECRYTEIPRAHGPPATWAPVYRALLHQDSIMYRRMQTYWDTQSRWTPLIKPRATEHDYTKAVSNIAQCTYTQVRHSPA